MAKKGLTSIFAAFLLIASLISISALSGCKEKTAYEKTLEGIEEIDNAHGMDIDDYKYGMDYLWENPRFPKPTNAEDIPAIVDEFSELKKEALEDEASGLLINGRIRLLESEKFYKLAKKYPSKGYVEDGFSCGEVDEVLETAKNLNTSVMHGRIAIENLDILQKKYPKEADVVDVSPFWLKSVNKTFDNLAEVSLKNVNVISHFCLNETTPDDNELEQEFGKANDLMKEAQPEISRT
ncbi:hypothetical protein COV19_02020 [Candidatus Woesearchaeota archaeon CG10_big_fil_rev_8_21_14_0_10_44_13]|nr:MAG: hypothetical protein COV19_02020 [Candidatus Woesearchaeota archaeon CG10_big_fil_rev_8_21_14_0_10_44_13]